METVNSILSVSVSMPNLVVMPMLHRCRYRGEVRVFEKFAAVSKAAGVGQGAGTAPVLSGKGVVPTPPIFEHP